MQIFLDIEEMNDEALEAYLKTEDINARNQEGESLLHTAIKYDNEYAFDLLMRSYINVNLKNNNGDTPLIYSIIYNKLAYFKRLVREHANINLANNRNETPIMIALDHNKIDMAKILFDENADLSIKNENEETIFFSLIRSHNLELFSKMIKSNRSFISSTNYSKRSLLHQAVMVDDFKITKYLLDQGLLPNLEDNFGETPIFFAVRNNNEEIVSLLIERGALIEKRNAFFETALDVAGEKMRDYLQFKIEGVRYSKYLKKFPLHCAIIYNDYSRCKQLASRSMVNKKDDFGYLPIDYAKQLNHLEIYRLLEKYNKKNW